jgi:hypothetical protein
MLQLKIEEGKFYFDCPKYLEILGEVAKTHSYF